VRRAAARPDDAADPKLVLCEKKEAGDSDAEAAGEADRAWRAGRTRRPEGRAAAAAVGAALVGITGSS